jgi:hypothetical protein
VSTTEAMGGTIKVTVDDPVLAVELRDFLRCATCIADREGPRSIVVALPSAADSRAARASLVLIVAGWQALHPHAHASVAANVRRRVER